MKSSFEYDHDFEPPAPVLPVRYRSPVGGEGVVLPSLVDTGADLCVLPAEIARELNLPWVGRADVEGVGETTFAADIFAAVLEVADTSQIVEVLALTGESLVGRNALNRWKVRLDGPSGQIDISQ